MLKTEVATNSKKRIVWVDLLETVAIFFVVFYHTTIYFWDVGSSDATISTYLAYFARTILSTCVPLFFFANGFLMFRKNFDLKKHIFRILRFIILTELWSVITLVLLMVIRSEYLSAYEFVVSVQNRKQGWTNHLWYLGVLICLYLIFPILKYVYDNHKKLFKYFVIICALTTFAIVFINQIDVFVCTVLFKKTYSIGLGDFFNSFVPLKDRVGYNAVYFCVGGLINDYIDKIKGISPVKRNIGALAIMFFSCLGLFAVGIMNTRFLGNTWDVVWDGYDSVFTFCNVLCIFTLCLNLQKDIPVLSLISKNTLGVYFIHGFIIALTTDYITSRPELCNMPFNIIYAIIVLAISVLISVILRKIPLVKKIV